MYQVCIQRSYTSGYIIHSQKKKNQAHEIKLSLHSESKFVKKKSVIITYFIYKRI